MSIANMNPETGIRYGTIYLNNLDGDTAAYLFDEGRNVSEYNALQELRHELVFEADDMGFEDEEEMEAWLQEEFERRVENLNIEEPTIEGECDGVTYMISWLGGAPLLWVFNSPHVGTFDLCSPCVPGACNLESPDPEGYVGYTVPPDWLRKEI